MQVPRARGQETPSLTDGVPGVPEKGPARRRARQVAKVLASVALTTGLFTVALPKLSGVAWRDVYDVLTILTWRQVAQLTVIWFGGLYAYSFVLTAGLPGLSRRRALTLNLTGSAVSNVVPLGGAVGMGVNYAMTRSWGFTNQSFTLYTLLTNLWNLMIRLSLPAIALGMLVLAGGVTSPRLVTTSLFALVMLAVILLTVAAFLFSELCARAIGRIAGLVVRGALRLAGSGRRPDVQRHVIELRHQSIGIIKRAWPQMSAGMLAYSALQALLLYTALHALGSTLTVTPIFAGYALERVLAFVVVTPGGAGVVEVGMTALLVGLGGDPVITVAGVLLYRLFVFGLEIPVGGVGLFAWLWRQRKLRRQASPLVASHA
jgi:putative heme transporter